MRYDDLLDRLVFVQGENTKEVFSSTLSFLYLLGKIQYNKNLDTIELLR
ncbi:MULTISPECIES: ABC-three component system middle component 8 [Bacteroides]